MKNKPKPMPSVKSTEIKHKMYCAKSNMRCAVFHSDGICPDVRDCEACKLNSKEQVNINYGLNNFTNPKSTDKCNCCCHKEASYSQLGTHATNCFCQTEFCIHCQPKSTDSQKCGCHCHLKVTDIIDYDRIKCQHCTKIERKPIAGYEGYEIDTEGNVWSCRYGFNQTGKFNSGWKKLKNHVNKRGYYVVTLAIKKKHNIKTIHKLLGEAFIPNPDNKPFVLHKDGHPLNIALDNLYWGTPKENHEDAVRHGTWHGNKPKSDCTPPSITRDDDWERILTFSFSEYLGKEMFKSLRDFIKSEKALSFTEGSKKAFKRGYDAGLKYGLARGKKEGIEEGSKFKGQGNRKFYQQGYREGQKDVIELSDGIIFDKDRNNSEQLKEFIKLIEELK